MLNSVLGPIVSEFARISHTVSLFLHYIRRDKDDDDYNQKKESYQVYMNSYI